jgi:hypothetical protein
LLDYLADYRRRAGFDDGHYAPLRTEPADQPDDEGES